MIKQTKKCEFCGKTFEAKQPFQRFCCPHCCYKNKLLQAKDERQTRKRRHSPVGKSTFIGYKLWDINNPECREVALFIKTIRPIDFKALAAEQEAERQARLRKQQGGIGGRYYPHGRKKAVKRI